MCILHNYILYIYSYIPIITIILYIYITYVKKKESVKNLKIGLQGYVSSWIGLPLYQILDSCVR